jgi:hypothetical protein
MKVPAQVTCTTFISHQAASDAAVVADKAVNQLTVGGPTQVSSVYNISMLYIQVNLSNTIVTRQINHMHNHYIIQDTALFDAIKINDLDAVRLSVDKGANVHAVVGVSLFVTFIALASSNSIYVFLRIHLM